MDYSDMRPVTLSVGEWGTLEISFGRIEEHFDMRVRARRDDPSFDPIENVLDDFVPKDSFRRSFRHALYEGRSVEGWLPVGYRTVAINDKRTEDCFYRNPHESCSNPMEQDEYWDTEHRPSIDCHEDHPWQRQWNDMLQREKEREFEMHYGCRYEYPSNSVKYLAESRFDVEDYTPVAEADLSVPKGTDEITLDPAERPDMYQLPHE